MVNGTKVVRIFNFDFFSHSHVSIRVINAQYIMLNLLHFEASRK